MMARAFACCLIVSLVVIPAPAQTPLLWQFAKGQIYEIERDTIQKQSVEVRGKQFKQERQSSWHIRLEVKEPRAEGFQIAAVLTKVQQKLSGGKPIETIDPKLAEKMQGCSFDLLVTPDGRLIELKGYEDFLDRLAGDDKERRKALRVSFPEGAVKEAFTDVFGPLPEKKVAPADAWQRTYVEPIPHFGALRCAVRYTYEGKVKEHDRIAYNIQTTYEAPKGENTELFRIVKGNIQAEKAEGTLTFDRAASQLVAHQRAMLLRGVLTIKAMVHEHPVIFSSEDDMKIRIKRRQ